MNCICLPSGTQGSSLLSHYLSVCFSLRGSCKFPILPLLCSLSFAIYISIILCACKHTFLIMNYKRNIHMKICCMASSLYAVVTESGTFLSSLDHSNASHLYVQGLCSTFRGLRLHCGLGAAWWLTQYSLILGRQQQCLGQDAPLAEHRVITWRFHLHILSASISCSEGRIKRTTVVC